MGFQQGLSGLNASSKNLEVIGNNVANANTIGAKESRAEFGDMYASAISNTSVGIGVNLQAVTQQFTQGNITTTDNPLDVAINGNGFFEVSNGNQTLYTRNGQFQADKDGFITNNAGMKLVGYPASKDGVIQPGAAVPLQLPTGGVAPNPTSNITVQMNLDSRKAATLPATTPQINFTDATTYNDATSVTVYDAKGQDVALTYYFQKSATDTWNVYATANGTSVKSDSSGNPLPVTTIDFPSNGGTPTAPLGTVSMDIPASTNAAGAATLPMTGVALDLTGATQFGSSFGVTSMKQDGYAAGQLVSVGDREVGRGHRDLLQRPIQAGRPARTRDLPQPAGPEPPGRQPLGPQLRLGRPDRRRAEHRQHRGAAGRRAGRVQHRPHQRAGQHDHRAARLPGQCADHQDRRPDHADAGQPALTAADIEGPPWTA